MNNKFWYANQQIQNTTISIYQLESASFPAFTKKKEVFFLRQIKGYVWL
jgi:hypothetical protein